MKLYRYKDFERSKEIRGIHIICKKFGIKNYTINDDLMVDIDGDVDLFSIELNNIPLKFGKVTGHFNCDNNQLKNLEGAPYEVGGSFHCSNNRLTSLKGGPEKVGGDFYCYRNELESLEGCPERFCSFICYTNKLTSLEGIPKEVSGRFDCRDNRLTSLKGGPKKVGGDFDFSENRINNFKGFPEFIGGDVSFFYNPVEYIIYLFPSPITGRVRCEEIVEYLNEYNVIRDGKKVVLQALELVYDELGLEVPENIEIEEYEII